MKTIEADQCADGQIFEDDRKAKAHDYDLLVQELDGILKLFKFDSLTRNQEYRALMQLMNNRKELRTSIEAIARLLELE